MTNYAGWSARQLKDAGQSVDAGPLYQVAQLLAYGETQATEINTGLRAALEVLMPGWSGQAAAKAHARTTGMAQDADTSARSAVVAQTKADGFATSMAEAAAQVSAMAAGDPPTASDYLFPWGLLSPAGATAAYLYQADQAENQRQALVAKITSMDTQGQNAGAGLVGSFIAGDSTLPPPPPASLPAAPGGGTGTGGTRSGPGAPTAKGSLPGATTPSTPLTPAEATPVEPGAPVPGSSGQTVPGAGSTPDPGLTGGSTAPGGSPLPAAASAGTLPQSFTAPAAQAGALAPPAPTVLPGGAGVGVGPVAGVGGLGAALLGGAAATGGAGAALGSSGVGLPGTVSGGWAAGAPGSLAAGPAGRPGYAVPPGAMRPGSGAQAPRRTIGRGGVMRTSAGSPAGGAAGGATGGTRPGVVPPAEQAVGGRTGGRTAGSARGAVGPAGRRRRDEDAGLAGHPDYLVESDDVWGDGRTVARGVLGQRPYGERPHGEGTDTP